MPHNRADVVIQFLRETAERLERGDDVAVILGVDRSGTVETTIYGKLPLASLLLFTLQSGLLESIKEERINVRLSKGGQPN